MGSIGDAAAVQPLVVAFIKDKRSDIWKEAEKALDSIDPYWQKSEAAKQAVLTMVAGLQEGVSAARRCQECFKRCQGNVKTSGS
jgi:hypothetical protein